jgi:hypothetical protein
MVPQDLAKTTVQCALPVGTTPQTLCSAAHTEVPRSDAVVPCFPCSERMRGC